MSREAPSRPDVEVTYPPGPWQLGGTMDVSVWRVPPSDLPRSLDLALPDGAAPVVVGGQSLVGTAFVRYEPGGVLAYDELLSAVLVRQGRRPRITVPDIWVDSPASLAGGRELWGIPKLLASFERSPGRRGTTWQATSEAAGAEDTTVLAELEVRAGRVLPGWRRLPLPMTQRLGEVEITSSARSLARVRLARHAWRFPVGSPLRYLEGRRPVLSVRLERMSVTFGDPGTG
jgi:hypothetical protein